MTIFLALGMNTINMMESDLTADSGETGKGVLQFSQALDYIPKERAGPEKIREKKEPGYDHGALAMEKMSELYRAFAK